MEIKDRRNSAKAVKSEVRFDPLLPILQKKSISRILFREEGERTVANRTSDFSR